MALLFRKNSLELQRGLVYCIAYACCVYVVDETTANWCISVDTCQCRILWHRNLQIVCTRLEEVLCRHVVIADDTIHRAICFRII